MERVEQLCDQRMVPPSHPIPWAWACWLSVSQTVLPTLVMAAASLPPSMTAGSANVTWSLALDLCRRVSDPGSDLDAEIEHPPGFFVAVCLPARPRRSAASKTR